jgi:hypothetical protein
MIIFFKKLGKELALHLNSASIAKIIYFAVAVIL